MYVCILAPPGEYDRTIRARRRCSLVSDYFDHSSFTAGRQHAVTQAAVYTSRCVSAGCAGAGESQPLLDGCINCISCVASSSGKTEVAISDTCDSSSILSPPPYLGGVRLPDSRFRGRRSTERSVNIRLGDNKYFAAKLSPLFDSNGTSYATSNFSLACYSAGAKISKRLEIILDFSYD